MDDAGGMLRIGEAAEELNVTTHWLRLGEATGSLPPARRSVGGHRLYTKQDVERLRSLGVGELKRQLAERDG
jgi:DNA-binding transcriptional MerR regulator